MGAIQKIIRGGVALALGALLADSAAPAAARAEAVGAFEVTGGTQGEGYSYADGVLTVNDGADITLSMVGGATEPTSDRIVVAANATATITLNGVSITGPGPDISSVAPAQSAIDVGENAHLILNLSDNKNKTLTGGSGGTDLGAPGIHVPSSASLFVQGSGGLSVQGGSSTTTYGGNGIGDKPNTQQSGGACGTVIILATGNVTVVGGDGQSSVSDGLDIGGGQGTTNGDDGQGIKPAGDGTYTVYGDLTLPCDVTIPAGATLTIPDGASLTVPESTTLTNNGTILVQGGTFTNSGTVNGNQPTFPSTVTVSFGQNGQTVTSVPHGSTVTITATMERAETAANALSADTGKVDFYLGAVEDGTKLNEDGVSVTKGSDGTYTAALEVTLDGEDWKPGESPYIITADFGGYAPEGDESGDSLAPNTGSAELTVTKAEQTEPIGTFFTTSSTENSITVTFTDVTQPENENGIEIAYAVGPTASEPTSDWTTATKSSSSSLYTAEIENLSPGTPCIFFARYKGDDTHEPSPAIASSSAFYTKPKIATQGLPNAYVGVEYSQKLEAVAAGGVAVSWTITSGTQPAGLTLNSDGTITGTPTAPATQAANFTVNATIGEGASSVFSTRILAISVTKSDAELGNLTVSGQTGFDGHFQYGDTITVTSIPERKTDTSTNALAEDTAALTYTNAGGEEVTLATATAQEDGSFKLTYDTKEKKLPIGEDLSLAVSYGGSDALNPAEETVTLTLDQAILKNVPLVSGEFVYGETLTVNYTPQDDETVTYQWYRGGEIISSATEASYTPTAEDIGKKILVEVIAADEWHSGRMRSTERMVAMAPGSIEIACDSVTYGEAVAPTVTSNTNEGADVTFTYTGTDGTSYGPSSEAPEDAGTYAVTATVAETATHTSATSDPVAFTIGRAALGASQGLALTSDAPGTATASWDAVPNASGYTVRLYKDGQAHGDAAVVTGTSHEFSIPEPGTYTVKVRANGSDNYADSAETEASLAFFSVSFVTDDAGAVDPQIVADGGHAIEPTDPTRDGYVFAGWYSDAGFAEGSAWDFTASTVSAATSLYAKWLSTDAGVESVAVKGEAAKIEGASISVSLPYGTEIGSADIAITPAAGAAVSDLVATADDCSAWRFTVTAEDGRTTAGYEIAVTFTPVDSSLAVTPSSASLTYGDVLEVTVIPGIASAKALSAMPNTVELYCGEALLASSERQSPDGSYALTYDTAGKGLAIGANTLTLRYGGDGSLNPSTAELSVTLGKLSVTASLGGVTEKVYDAGTDAPEGLTIDFSGALEGDEVTVSYASAAYDSKDVAAASAITATGVELGGADAGWYELDDDVVVIAGRITPAPIAGTVSVSGSAVSGRTLTASYAAAGDELLTFQWLRDGESVSGATGGLCLDVRGRRRGGQRRRHCRRCQPHR